MPRAVALILPPTQSFTMPYSAPFVLAAWLQELYRASTIVIDAGIEWLLSETSAQGPDGMHSRRVLAQLRQPETYRDTAELRRAFHSTQARTRRTMR